MTRVAEELDRELEYLARLAHEYPKDSRVKEAVLARIDLLLDQRITEEPKKYDLHVL